MTIRNATEQDIPGIVELTRLSLGESLMPKSIEFWNWKHTQNPFGKSRVLLALDGDKIIGVRAFMFWHWRQGNRVITALRAVDTATHPDYQGRGIFKKLTMKLVEEAKEDKVDFIYNTPNTSSKPGYLKMGWFVYQRMPLHFLFYPISFLARKYSTNIEKLSKYELPQDLWTSEELNNLLSRHMKDNSTLYSTEISREYLRWRYSAVVGIKYYCLYSFSNGYFLVFRIKRTIGNTIELRVCDFFVDKEKWNKRAFVKSINELRKVIRPSIVTISAMLTDFVASIVRNLWFSWPLPVGPEVTLREVSSSPMDLGLLANWSTSIGDLEVF